MSMIGYRITIPADATYCDLCDRGDGIIALTCVGPARKDHYTHYICEACLDVLGEAWAAHQAKSAEVLVHPDAGRGSVGYDPDEVIG